MGALATKLAKSEANIVTLDIERIPGRATHHHRGLTIEGDFWDLNGWKSTIGYRLPADSVTEWPRTICLAWAWYGKKRTEFASEWGNGREGMLQAAWDTLDRADVLYGHNAQQFDIRHLRAEFALIGWGEPSPYKVFDTLKVARREFAFESNTLDALCKRLGIDAKTDKYDVATAKAAVNGDAKAQKKLEKYNRGDIAASVALADVLRPWSHTHPNMGLFLGDDERACPKCGSEDIKLTDKRSLTNVTAYATFRCGSCGAISRANNRKAHATFRPVA